MGKQNPDMPSMKSKFLTGIKNWLAGSWKTHFVHTNYNVIAHIFANLKVIHSGT